MLVDIQFLGHDAVEPKNPNMTLYFNQIGVQL